MRSLFLFSVLLTILTACQQTNSNKTTTDSVKTTSAILHAGPQCFTQVLNRDTAYLRFQTDNEVITGQLEYKPFEKDKNSGTISGTINDDIIDVEYHYASEGTMSIRKAIFKIDGDSLFEAIADSLDKEGQPLFNNDYKKLKFDTTPFEKGKCR